MADVIDAVKEKAANDPHLRSVLKRVEKGSADFKDTADYSVRFSHLLGGTLSENVLDIPADIREAVAEELLKYGYDDINTVLADVQTAIDRRANIHIRPQKADFPSERVQQFAHSLIDPTVEDSVIKRRARSGSETITKSFHDSFIKKNAAFRNDAGLSCYIIREGSGCCKWCSDVAGKYKFGTQPSDIFRRHDNCDCTIIYDGQVLRGKKNADGSRSKTWEEVPDADGKYEPKVLSETDARAAEQRNLQQYRGVKINNSSIDNGGRSGIMEENKKLYPEALAGVKRGSPMTFEEADSGNVNPNYGRKGYDTNCQACTIVNEARRRGYDVEALPNMPNSMAEKLAHQYPMAWINPETGKKPEFIVDKSKDTPKKYLEFMHSTIQPNARYVIGFTWKGKGNSGHIVNLDINEYGELRIKDNQRGTKERSEWTGDKAVMKYLKHMKWSETAKVPKMMRIDNLQFEPDVAKKIMKGRSV